MNRRLALALVLCAPALAAGGPPAGGASQPGYTRFATLTATIPRANGQRGVLSVEAGVDVADATLRSRAVQSTPRLRAAYADVLRDFGAALLPGRPPDLERLSRELQAATDRTLGRGGARLLLGTVLAS